MLKRIFITLMLFCMCLVFSQNKEIVKGTAIESDARQWTDKLVVETVWYIDFDELVIYIYGHSTWKFDKDYLEEQALQYARKWIETKKPNVFFNGFNKTKDVMKYNFRLGDGAINLYEMRLHLNRVE